jgi:hypothetical protein
MYVNDSADIIWPYKFSKIWKPENSVFTTSEFQTLPIYVVDDADVKYDHKKFLVIIKPHWV